ncbi:MAG: S41 family peptidase [Thermoanaerobaculia bacterium]|nr:S41 family peptidase [Thermoanaerobaculia bacterium]
MRRRWKITAVVVFVLSLLSGGLFGPRVLAFTDEARGLLRSYTELVTVIHENAAREVAYRDLVFSSINGMLRQLDPHTAFLSPEAYDNMRDRQRSSFYGLGILVGMRNGLLTVITPIEGTPASRMGMRAGDVISTIEGQPTDSMGINDAVRQLKGPKGTQVTIEVVRAGLDEPLELTITRDEIPQNTVRYAYMIRPDTGYIAISDFNRGTGREVQEAIERLQEQGMRRLLLDLRNNGGGLLDQAIEVSDLFLPEGARIVETRGRTRDSFQEYSATGSRPDVGLPVVVLVNNGTASAAEILAGAIQDHDVGLIVGSQTWGKGLVQTVYSLSYGAGIALTTAKYYTPSGRLIQRDYTSFFDYQNHPGRLTEAEDELPGSEELARPTEIFRTDLGREVYGGGGITPDIEVPLEELPPYLQYLLSRSAFFDYAVLFTSENQVEGREWWPDDETLAGFSKWLVEGELSSPEEIEEALADPEVRAAVARQLRAEVFNAAFDFQARHQVLADGDPQIQRALELFGEASALLSRRQGLEDEPATPAREGVGL